MGTLGFTLPLVVDFPSRPRFWSGVMIVLWLFALAAISWQIIGVWRSAGQHVSRGGSSGWALAARAAILVGSLQVGVLVITQAAPQVWEFAVMLADRDPVHGYQIQPLRDGSEIEVSGYIAFGLTSRLAAALDANPGVTLVHLNSSGGRVAEARRLRDLIASRRLSTYTSRQCTSACVIAFLAGERRLISPDAKIGFHQYSVAGRSGVLTAADMEKDKRYFISRGVSAPFVDRAFLPTSVMWYPTPEEMLAANYVTGYAGSGEVALSGMSAGEIDRLEQTLREDPLYAAIQEVEPAAYQQIVAAVTEGFQRGQSLADLRTRTLPIVQEVYRTRLAFASDEAVVAFGRLMLDELAVLRPHPDMCLAYLSRNSGVNTDFRLLFGRDLVQREQAVIADVIRSAAGGSSRPPGQAEVEPLRAEVTGRLLRNWSPEDLEQLADVDRPGTDPDRACAVCYGFYKVIVDLPVEKAGPMLRYTFSGGGR